MPETNGKHTLDLHDIDPVEIPFEYGGKSYVLKEASEHAVKTWRNAVMRSRSIDYSDMDHPKITSTGIQPELMDTPSLLVSLCLFHRATGEQDRPVPVEEVDQLPGRLVRRLFERAMEISELNKKDDAPSVEELAKNAPTSTTVG